MRLSDPNDATAGIRVRFLMACLLMYVVLALVSAVVQTNFRPLGLALVFPLFGSIGFIFYLPLVRTRLGAWVGGVVLFGGNLGVLIWLFSIQLDDGLEALMIPFVSLWAGLGTLLLEIMLFRPLEQD